MTRTRVSKFPLLLGGAAVIAVVAFMATAGGDDKSLPRDTSSHCGGRTAEVEMGAQMNKNRPVKMRWWVSGSNHPPATWEGTTDYWETADPKMPCDTTLQFVVSPGDVWGGDTHCWVSVNGRDVAESRVRLRENCHLIVRLIGE